MWSYYVLCISSFPVLGPLMVALGLWLLPVRRAIEPTVFLLASWMTISYFLVCKTPKPDTRITQEHEKLGWTQAVVSPNNLPTGGPALLSLQIGAIMN